MLWPREFIWFDLTEWAVKLCSAARKCSYELVESATESTNCFRSDKQLFCLKKIVEWRSLNRQSRHLSGERHLRGCQFGERERKTRRTNLKGGERIRSTGSMVNGWAKSSFVDYKLLSVCQSNPSSIFCFVFINTFVEFALPLSLCKFQRFEWDTLRLVTR